MRLPEPARKLNFLQLPAPQGGVGRRGWAVLAGYLANAKHNTFRLAPVRPPSDPTQPTRCARPRPPCP
eukprot:2468183-Alexandrium_andersonii.AAC.1